MGRAALIATTALLALAACTTPQAPPANMEITFQHRAPVQLDVALIDVVDAFEPVLAPPHVEHLHNVTPVSLVRRWAAERLVAAGTRGQATFVIEQAEVIESAIARSEGFADLFNDEPDTRLDARLKGRLEYVDVGPPGRSYAASVNAQASTEILESATLNERDLAYFHLMEKLAAAFDEALLAEVQYALGPVIRN